MRRSLLSVRRSCRSLLRPAAAAQPALESLEANAEASQGDACPLSGVSAAPFVLGAALAAAWLEQAQCEPAAEHGRLTDARIRVMRKWQEVEQDLDRLEASLPFRIGLARTRAPDVHLRGGGLVVSVHVQAGADVSALLEDLVAALGGGQPSDAGQEARTTIEVAETAAATQLDLRCAGRPGLGVRVRVPRQPQSAAVVEFSFAAEAQLGGGELEALATAMRAANGLRMPRSGSIVPRSLQAGGGLPGLLAGAHSLLGEGAAALEAELLRWEQGVRGELERLVQPPEPGAEGGPSPGASLRGSPHAAGLQQPGQPGHDYGSPAANAAVAQLERLGAVVYPPGAGEAVDWGALAGYEQQKELIEETLLLALRHPDVFAEVAGGTRARPGGGTGRARAVLLEGPPGCGKTTSARPAACDRGAAHDAGWRVLPDLSPSCTRVGAGLLGAGLLAASVPLVQCVDDDAAPAVQRLRPAPSAHRHGELHFDEIQDRPGRLMDLRTGEPLTDAQILAIVAQSYRPSGEQPVPRAKRPRVRAAAAPGAAHGEPAEAILHQRQQEAELRAARARRAGTMDAWVAGDDMYYEEEEGRLEDILAAVPGPSSAPGASSAPAALCGFATARQMQEVRNKTEANRSGATKKLYETHTRHFAMWCEEKKFRPIPHADLVFSFILWRTQNTIGMGHLLTHNTITNCIQGLQYSKTLLEEATGMGLGLPLNAHSGIAQMKANMKRELHARNLRDKVDPHKGTMAGILSRDGFAKLCHVLNDNGLNHEALRDGSMVKTARAAMFRGDELRRIRLCELSHIEMPKNAVGPDVFEGVTIITKQGKTNKVNRAETGSMFRAHDVALCPVGALASHLYHRFMVRHETHRFDDANKAWFEAVLYPSSADNTHRSGLNSETYSKMLELNFAKAGISPDKRQHAFRSSAAYDASCHGCSFEDIARTGRWSEGGNRSMNLSYTQGPAAAVALVLAGFPNALQAHVLSRGCHKPSEELVNGVFPFASAQLAAIQAREIGPLLGMAGASAGSGHGWRAQLRPVAMQNQLLAAKNFLGLLRKLAVFLLQDMAVWDDHPLANEQLARTPAFLAFKSELRAKMAAHEAALLPLPRTAEMQALQTDNNMLVARLELAMTELQATRVAVERAEATPGLSADEIDAIVVKLAARLGEQTRAADGLDAQLSGAPVAAAAGGSAPQPSGATAAAADGSRTAARSSGSRATGGAPGEELKFILDSRPSSVSAVWEAFSSCGYHGRPPIVQLVAMAKAGKFGPRGSWHPAPVSTAAKNSRVNTWHCIWKPVIRHILALVHGGEAATYEEAVKVVEGLREALPCPTVRQVVETKALGPERPNASAAWDAFVSQVDGEAAWQRASSTR